VKDIRKSFIKRKALIVKAIKESHLKSSAGYPLLINHDGVVTIKGRIASGTKISKVDILGLDVYVDVTLCDDVEYIIETGVNLNNQEFVQLAYELGGYDVGNNVSKINARYAYSDCDRGQKSFERFKAKQKISVREDGTRITFPNNFFI